MMPARVADSLYCWPIHRTGRASLAPVVRDAERHPGPDGLRDPGGLDRHGRRGRAGRRGRRRLASEAAEALVLDRGDPNSVVSSLARARENARQVRDQIDFTETWERLEPAVPQGHRDRQGGYESSGGFGRPTSCTDVNR
ncbi:alpha-E domain-containing protein [Caulobacter segnis]